ncbi:hypothetical protein [Chitinimonas naiadis]
MAHLQQLRQGKVDQLLKGATPVPNAFLPGFNNQLMEQSYLRDQTAVKPVGSSPVPVVTVPSTTPSKVEDQRVTDLELLMSKLKSGSGG